MEYEYIKSLGITRDVYNKKVDRRDRNAARGLALYMAVNGEAISVETIKEIVNKQKAALMNENKTLRELRSEANGIINEIMNNPLVSDKSKMEEVKKSLTILTETTANFAVDRLIGDARSGMTASTEAGRRILTAA